MLTMCQSRSATGLHLYVSIVKQTTTIRPVQFVRWLSLNRRFGLFRRASVLLSGARLPTNVFNCQPILSHRVCSSEVSKSFHIQDYDDFRDRVLSNSNELVLADFHADWCGPCRLLGPRLEQIVDGRQGKVLLAKINIDDCADIAMDYKVEVVPTVIAFKKGEPVDQFTGMMEDEGIQAFLNRLEGP